MYFPPLAHLDVSCNFSTDLRTISENSSGAKWPNGSSPFLLYLNIQDVTFLSRLLSPQDLFEAGKYGSLKSYYFIIGQFCILISPGLSDNNSTYNNNKLKNRS